MTEKRGYYNPIIHHEENGQLSFLPLPNPHDFSSPDEFNHALSLWESQNAIAKFCSSESYVTENPLSDPLPLHKTEENPTNDPLTQVWTIIKDQLTHEQQKDLNQRLNRLLLELETPESEPFTPQTSRKVRERKWLGDICYQLEDVRCGKPTCTQCPHGPYWYSYQRVNGKVKSKYIGKNEPN